MNVEKERPFPIYRNDAGTKMYAIYRFNAVYLLFLYRFHDEKWFVYEINDGKKWGENENDCGIKMVSSKNKQQ